MKLSCNKVSMHMKFLNSFFFFGLITSSQAETITIGRDSGVLWEGFYFNETLSGPNGTQVMTAFSDGIIAIGTRKDQCMLANNLVNIAGYLAFPIAPGVGLIPRASGNASFSQNSAPPTGRYLSGTLGVPETAGIVSPTNTQVRSIPGKAWCLPPSMVGDHYFYAFGSQRTVSLSGSWLLVADGTQVTGNYKIPPMYFASYTASNYDLSARILPDNISLRVSTLKCTVNTPVDINFGTVSRSILPAQELASATNPITVSCNQTSDLINANINVQFRAINGIYNANPSQLSLKQSGGYITGEINSGVTGSGDCALSQGLKFDNTPYKIGGVSNVETSVVINNQITWRLCSGGNSLPTGPVDTSTEMLVTFN